MTACLWVVFAVSLVGFWCTVVALAMHLYYSYRDRPPE